MKRSPIRFSHLLRAYPLLVINVLNQTGDARGMVTGFANSTEYRQRFGPP